MGNGQPAGDQRNEILSRLAFLQAKTDPAGAANFILDRIPEGQAQTEALMSVIHQWAVTDPEAATVWVDKFPPNNPLTDRAQTEVANQIQYQQELANQISAIKQVVFCKNSFRVCRN